MSFNVLVNVCPIPAYKSILQLHLLKLDIYKGLPLECSLDTAVLLHLLRNLLLIEPSDITSLPQFLLSPVICQVEQVFSKKTIFAKFSTSSLKTQEPICATKKIC